MLTYVYFVKAMAYIEIIITSWETYVWDEVRALVIQQKVYSFIVLSWAKELREQVIFLCRKSAYCSFRQCSDWCSSQVPHVEGKKSPLIGIWVEIRPIGHPRLSLIKLLFLTNLWVLFKSEQKKLLGWENFV